MLSRYAKRWSSSSSCQSNAGRAVQASRCMPAYRCRAFEACSVDAHVRLRGSHAPNTPKIAAKIDPESRPGPSLGHLKSVLGRSRGDLGPQKGATRRLRRVLGRSWAIPRAARGDPEDAPGPLRSASGTPLERLGDLFGVSRREKSSSSVPSYARPVRDALAKRVCDDFRSIFGWSAQGPTFTKYRACQQKQGFSSVRYVSSRTCNATSKNLENCSENRPAIVENHICHHPEWSIRLQEGHTGRDFPRFPGKTLR